MVLCSFLCMVFAQQPVTGRVWSYINCTGILTSRWAYVMMPGFRYEFARDDAQNSDTKKMYFYELLTGPVFITRANRLTIKIPFWYYYMGFPVAGTDNYYYSHNVELLPIIEYRSNRVLFTSRTIFHNTVYASVYETDEMRKGYGLVVRQLFKLEYFLNPGLSVVCAEEPFLGVIEDGQAPAHALGYWQRGFRMNRIYLGMGIKLNQALNISPQYVFETTYGESTELTGINHYLHVMLTWVVRL
jgi:hypothetical protein